MKPFFNPEPVVLAHRGDSVNFPENTYPAFKSAYDMKADVIETDVHLSKDGVCVVWHDDFVTEFVGRECKITDLTLEEIKRLDAGMLYTRDGEAFPFASSGIQIMTLVELIESFPDMKFNIDLKDENPELVKVFSEIIRKYNMQDKICVGSFHHSNLVLVRKLIPGVATTLSSREVALFYFLHRTGFSFLKKKFEGDALQIPVSMGIIRIVTPLFVKDIHSKGLKIEVWTINEEKEMKRLLDMGVDGIFSDDPALLKKVAERR